VSLDNYDVFRELGRGGMAVVHLARQRELGRLVALKELAGINGITTGVPPSPLIVAFPGQTKVLA